MQEQMNRLEQRLARAERQVRMLCLLALAGVVAVAGLLLQRPAVTAERGSTVQAPFTVTDAQNKPLFTVEANPIKVNGGATVRLFNEQGHEYAMFDNSQAGGSLALFTRTREMALSLNAQRDGGYLTMNNNAGRECVLLTGSVQQNGPKLILRSQSGEPLFSKP